MSLDAPSAPAVNAAPFRVVVVAARFNQDLVEALLVDVQEGLLEAGVRERSISVERVPGSGELATAAQWVARVRRPHAIVALGVIIRGGTMHHELIARTSAQALQQVALDSGIPVINGVIVAENRRQADQRCGGAMARGAEFARAAVEMAALKRRISR